MTEAHSRQLREERLAEKLRENLRRRKVQAKEQEAALSKSEPKS